MSATPTRLRLSLPPRGHLTPNNAVDPLGFYYTPLVGRLFRARIDIGLSLLSGRFHRMLEIGYGSGLLLPTLHKVCDELHGADLEVEPPGLRERLSSLSVRAASLVRADISQLPFPDGYFDGVVAFSILEHLRAHELGPALAEVARVLEPGGKFLIGCPAVHKAMNAAFSAIGFHDIESHHFSGLPDILKVAEAHFTVARRETLPPVIGRVLPLGWAPYSCVLLTRR